MGAVFLLICLAIVKSAIGQALPGTPAANQLQQYLNSTLASGPEVLTTTFGVPVRTEDAEFTMNRDLLFNPHFLEEITAFNRERIPQRVVHGKGVGAYGYFEVTHDVTHITNLVPFTKIGKVTPVFARFSSSFSSRGSPDTLRGTFGFAAKFYTEEGNWDFLGFTTDTFQIKDPKFFPATLHGAFVNPKTSLPDFNALLDLLILRKEAVSILFQFFGDMGIPLNYRHIAAHSLHTFQVENDKQEVSYIRLKMDPVLGVKYMNTSEGARMAGIRPDLYTEDMYNSIELRQFPTWTYGMQVIPAKDVAKAGFDIFDVTLRWPEKKYPALPIGKFVLNKNPVNYHKDVEQAAFNPLNLIPGIQGIDKMIEARAMAYRDAQLYRLGTNFNKIEVNCPLAPVNTYTRDGRPPVLDNGGGVVNYYPNSYNGPAPSNNTRTRTPRTRVYTNPEATNFKQAADYVDELTDPARLRLVQNLASAFSTTYPSVREAGVKFITEVHPRIGAELQAALEQAAANAAATVAAFTPVPISD